MKILRLKKHITVILNDGMMLTSNTCTDEIYNQIVNNQEDEDLAKSLLIPEYAKKEEEATTKIKLLDDWTESKYLTVVGSSVYIKTISELTLPEDLAVAIYKAELAGDKELVDTYLNFWTLCSLNPDSRARINLFWFLNRYGMTISKSGLFVAYRNVRLKKEGSGIDTKLADFVSAEYTRVKHKLKKSPKNYVVGYKEDSDELSINTDRSKLSKVLGMLDEMYLKLSDETVAPTYTDAHSGSFTIKIGEVVSMPREECDSVQENTCSRGLHVAGKQWLEANGNYFGNISLMVLVNPADVVAVPPSDGYGKMRCCAYYPISIIQRDEDRNIIDEGIDDGFEDNFMHQIAYNGEVNTEDEGNYTINIPEIPELNRKLILARLQEISKTMNKYVD